MWATVRGPVFGAATRIALLPASELNVWEATQ